MKNVRIFISTQLGTLVKSRISNNPFFDDLGKTEIVHDKLRAQIESQTIHLGQFLLPKDILNRQKL
jgi:hypothetical protein